MSIDLSKINIGDTIVAKIVVKAKVGCRVKTNHSPLPDSWISGVDIIEHIPAPREVKVGDKITPFSPDHVWEVLAVNDGQVWIRNDAGAYCTVSVAFVQKLLT